MNAAPVVAAARRFVGTPFQHQARLPGVGLDCAGLVVCALREAGQPVEDLDNYGRIPAQGLFERMVERQCARIEPADLQAGDLILFAFREAPQHIAIYTEAGTIIHSHQAVHGVVEHDFDASWRARMRGCYRVMEHK